MDEDEYTKHFRAIDFQMKMQKQIHYLSTRKALTEVIDEMFSKEKENEDED